jgi:hypothetical protein
MAMQPRMMPQQHMPQQQLAHPQYGSPQMMNPQMGMQPQYGMQPQMGMQPQYGMQQQPMMHPGGYPQVRGWLPAGPARATPGKAALPRLLSVCLSVRLSHTCDP